MKNDFFATDDISNDNNTPNTNNEENSGVIINLESTTSTDGGSSDVAINNSNEQQNMYYGTSIDTSVSSNEENNNLDNITNISNNDDKNAQNNVTSVPNKKILIIIGIIVGIIIIAIIALFVYVKFKFTATNYINEKVQDFETFIDEVFANINYGSYSDSISSGSFKISSNMDELAMLNDATLNFDVGYSYDKEIVDFNVNLLKNDDSILDAKMYIDSVNMYLDSMDLYDSVLYMPLEENPFADLNAEDTIDVNELQSNLKNIVKYLGIALEEAEVTSEIKGLNAVYTYQINDSNKEAFASRLKELIDSDTDMVNTLNMLGITDTTIDASAIEDIFLEIIVKIPSGDIEGFTFVTTDLEIVLENVENNVYELKINDQVIDVNVNDNDVTLNYENDERSMNVTYNLVDYTLNGNISVEGYEYNLNITNTQDNGKNIVFDFDSDVDANLLLDVTINKISDTESNIVGSLEFSSLGINLGLDIEVNNKLGNDLLDEQTYNNAINIDTLTTAQQNEINNNLLNILTELGFEDVLSTSNEAFIMNIYAVNDAAISYFIAQELQGNQVSCVTITDLINMGYLELDVNTYCGKVNKYEDNYIISLTDGNLMVLDVMDSDIGDRVREFDAATFSSYYYTCY